MTDSEIVHACITHTRSPSMSFPNYPVIRAAFCSRLPCQLYAVVARLSTGWHQTLVADERYQQAKRCCTDLYATACTGRQDLLDLVTSKGNTDWNWALRQAAYEANAEMIDMCIRKGATDWNGGLCAGALGGWLGVVHYFYYVKGARDLEGASKAAAQGRRPQLMDHF